MGQEGRGGRDDAALTGYVKVYRFMGSVLGLSGLELLVFARVFGFTACGRPFYESRSKTAAFFGKSRRAVISAVGSLVDKGLIVEEPAADEGRSGTKVYVANMGLVARALGVSVGDLTAAGPADGEGTSPEPPPPGEEASPGGGEPASPGQVKNLHPIPKRKANLR